MLPIILDFCKAFMYHLFIKIAFTLQKADWRIHGQKITF